VHAAGGVLLDDEALARLRSAGLARRLGGSREVSLRSVLRELGSRCSSHGAR